MESLLADAQQFGEDQKCCKYNLVWYNLIDDDQMAFGFM